MSLRTEEDLQIEHTENIHHSAPQASGATTPDAEGNQRALRCLSPGALQALAPKLRQEEGAGWVSEQCVR